MKRKTLFFANTSPGQNLLPPPKVNILQNVGIEHFILINSDEVIIFFISLECFITIYVLDNNQAEGHY